MSHEAKIHDAQTKILRELLFLPEVNFAALQRVTGLESDHAKFHIKRLVELGYVDKTGAKYKLSVKGKEYANKLDTDAGVIERQPKVAVLLVIERERGELKEYLVQQRLKHPYYGYWGAPTGKVRWGESILETASRELMEETGLTAVFTQRGVFHERVRHSDSGEIVEDKIFNIMFTDAATGTLLEQYDGGRNAWRTMEDIQTETKKYKSFLQEMTIGITGSMPPVVELLHEYGSDEF